jgi:hypothetical protein
VNISQNSLRIRTFQSLHMRRKDVGARSKSLGV